METNKDEFVTKTNPEWINGGGKNAGHRHKSLPQIVIWEKRLKAIDTRQKKLLNDRPTKEGRAEYKALEVEQKHLEFKLKQRAEHHSQTHK